MSNTRLREDLQRQLEVGDVVAVVGAGVTIGATNNNPVASWHGLLHDGVDRCRAMPTTGVTEELAQSLRQQIDSGNPIMMVTAAEAISASLGAPDGGEWRRWLRETVGALRAQQRDVLEALGDLGVTLATTNYDGLIEEVTGLPAVTWRDGARVERVLRGEDEGVLHLHGYWQGPESVILGVRDYERVLGDAHAQMMQRALRSLKTLLFVGYGEGLRDPNFGALLKWSATVFAGSEYRHFRLARDGELATLQAQHPADQRIFALGYGPDHSDLADFLRSLCPTERSTATKAEAPPRARPAVLPPAPLCVGREEEVEDLIATLLAERPAPVAILGSPGIGKSTLTLVALNDPRVADRYGQRRYFIRCDAVRTREALAAEIAAALDLPLGAETEAALLAELASAPAVLAIDNAETPWEADTLRVEEFLAHLAARPGLALIASLRGANRPMGVTWRHSVEPRSLALADARSVFLAIAGDHFTADPHLNDLLLALDGVPIAITLMAHAAEGQPDLDGTWTRWQHERTRMLQRADANHRLLNIEVSYEISIQGPRMTEEARRLLSLLGFLPGGVAHGDIDAVFPDHSARAAAILRQVGLAFDEGQRLRLLAPLREYVQREHPPAPDALHRLLVHYLRLVIMLGEKLGREGGAEAIARLMPEAGNLGIAILRALDEPNDETPIVAAISFGRFARFTGLQSTAMLEKAARIARLQEAIEHMARCIHSLGAAALRRSEYDTARKHYEEALPLFRETGDILGEANCVVGLGDLALRRGDYDVARKHYEEALPLYTRVGSIRSEANCISRLGDIALRRSEHNAAHRRYDEALPLYRRIGDIHGEANSLLRLGEIALDRSDYDSARKHLEDALPLFRDTGSWLGEANCILRLGEIALDRSEHETAHRHYEEALPLYTRIGDILGEANCVIGLGDLALRRGDYEAARRHYEEALRLYRRTGVLIGEGNSMFGLGEIAFRRSDNDTARKYYEEALITYERIPQPYSIGRTHRRLAHIAADDNERREHVNAAKDAWQSIGRGDLVSKLLEELGEE